MRRERRLVGDLRPCQESPKSGFAGRTTPRRFDHHGSYTTKGHQSGGGIVKTLAIRLEDDLHAQLSVLAQLEELTVTDAIRQAIEQFIESKRHNPELTARADTVLADIERDAAARREAIATLFKPSGDAAPKESSPAAAEDGGTTGDKNPSRSSRTRGGGPATS